MAQNAARSKLTADRTEPGATTLAGEPPMSPEESETPQLLREVPPKLMRFTLEVTEPFNSLLEDLANQSGTSKKDVVVRAVKLLHWLSALPGRDQADFALVDREGTVRRLYLNL